MPFRAMSFRDVSFRTILLAFTLGWAALPVQAANFSDRAVKVIVPLRPVAAPTFWPASSPRN